MKTYFECLHCFVRQTLDAVRMVTDDINVQEKILRDVLFQISNMDFSKSPPEMGQYIHRKVRELTGNKDPYKEVKEQFNKMALALYPKLTSKIQKSQNPMELSIRLAIVGNLIDFGACRAVDEEQVSQEIEQALHSPFKGDIEYFTQSVSKANKILYLADNTGEIVFDRLLIELLPLERITVAVKGSPTINDATYEDAKAANLTDLVKVIDNGTDAPGTILRDCSSQFLKYFEDADLIIAKGQGNYESLSEINKNISFLLKVKCQVISSDIGYPIGTMVLLSPK